ncbi:A/G-specific adenine glycosylase [Oharaeibacter diazotrophicus]|uniref:Adenine DNA glycosylase n=1 Tax=Oharaeibacter diazotrophicus TaxID=1920512 RepID=A0A4R6RB76_9HYPH|nr:A/G-specific adenine glycosylase [Oharaeibacter diazotrophicus]TDP83370.1 A/G-specific DNA-adenine glycosylase [Oharaeibacter diazotrophicus]BBE72203.1 A/G-specific adenine glycosylase [Pleomorphomonas sp. SM30]GLS78970.1 A/G-specific adenine glycosylase [Oharaeibacter diazotrophicus]
MTASAPITLARPDPADLLAWYDRHARRLPWRVPPDERAVGVVPDPYRVWLSEIMLQQTTVAAVKGYFEAFLARWPRLEDLAAAPRDDVMAAWAGLGYYSRARNLKACAEMVAERHGGRFPDDEAALRALPGIGAYTAAAIAAIAFDRPAVVVDGNVERIVTRLHAVETPLPEAKPEIRRLTEALAPPTRPGDFAQAMMDLGATICTPKRPACGLCPWQGSCAARAAGTQESYPRKTAKPERPVRRGTAYVAIRSDGAVLLRRRPDKGLLGGMAEVPGTEWAATAPPADPPLPADWRRAGTVEHTFTHFHLILTVETASVDAPAPAGAWWAPADGLADEALPSLMRKTVAAALSDRGPAPGPDAAPRRGRGRPRKS